jgi:hypothetical protein
MSPCRSEGELRSLIDRELPGEQVTAIEQHLAECAACAAAYQALSQRAIFVGSLMDSLSEEIPAGRTPARPTVKRPVFWATAAALAATLIFALVLSRHAANRPVQAIVEPPPAPSYVEPAPAPEPVRLPVASAAAREPQRVHRLPARRPMATPVQYYMALDEEPIDTGLVMRVALPSGVQADVIVDGDGRARAIRPVSTLVKEER